MSLSMKDDVQGSLVGSEIHGFHTLQDLDVKNIREEASARWLRPNEIHAILCNYKYFVIHVKPVNLPKSGTIVLFDRKMLRNFRKDGHNWKKKKDGKTVKEAHEHLKVGNVERIHVYYAHGLDNPTFVRRCYWLLDKSLEHVVLVHYRETKELIGFYRKNLIPGLLMSILLVEMNCQVANKIFGVITSFNNPVESTGSANSIGSVNMSLMGGQTNLNVESRESIPINSLDNLLNNGLQSQDSLGQWINEVITDSPGSVIDPAIEPSISSVHNSYCDSTLYHHQSSVEQIFNITENGGIHHLVANLLTTCKDTNEFDVNGQGVIHLCAILGYTWAVHLFVWSGLSINFRDKSGWTALHWAAYYGRERMVAALLSVGAKPSLITDPTSKNPLGYTAADLASMNGFNGLAAYLSEKALVSHFEDMSLAGNVSGSLETSTIPDTTNFDSVSEEQMYMKETLAAYRTAADAAARIQAAFREHSLKQRTDAIELSTPEAEARGIIAAMKIQHAFRNFETRKKMAAAARIQYRFRTWKIRKDFLNMRRQTIRIQAAFRGFQVRRQYRKIVWSVGIVEKAILRWRLKRKGFRGLQVAPAEVTEDQETGMEEDFYRVSQKQAEERVERAVIRVQAMFRSKKVQEEYRRMKLTHAEAALEYEELSHPDMKMNG
ncbi:Calmodulin-binding transcription activator 5, partial [Cucurbita argyrosperma subsp. sororia]